MPRKAILGAAGVGGDIPIAPSSTDWDYWFGTIGASGNALGDGTSGGNVSAIQATEALSGLITLDGDFVVAFTLVNRTNLAFGVHAIDEDDVRANNAHAGLNSMTNSFWWGIDYGTSGTQAMNGSTAEGSFTAPANNDELIIRRVSGTITLENVTTAATLRTFTSTYSGTIRLDFANGTGTTASVTDLFITDSSKIQRDANFNEGAGSNFTSGGSTWTNLGQLFPVTRSGSVLSVKVNAVTIYTSFNAHVEIWLDDGTNPSSQIGGDSDSINLTSTGEKVFNFTGVIPLLEKGQRVWAVIVDEDVGSGEIAWISIANGTTNSLIYASRASTITSFTDNVGLELAIEVAIDTSAGEPTPDHDTLLLIHSDTTDGSTTFTDSSQFGRTVSIVADSQHDTAQKKFGASSILFDGTGDYLTVPDSADFYLLGDFTIDCWLRLNAVGVRQGIITKTVDVSTTSSDFSIRMNAGNTVRMDIHGGTSAVSLDSPTVLTTGTWYHLCFMRSRNTFYNFIGGSLEASTTNASLVMPNSTALVKIGSMTFSGGQETLNGWVDEPRISRSARFDPAGFTPPTSAYP